MVAEYSAFGEVTGSGLDWMPFGFAGGIYDPDTGLVRFGARDYDPVVGRWTSKDPSGFEGGLNFYVYADNDPVNYVDVTGLKPTDIELLTQLAHWMGVGGTADMINERRAALGAVMRGDLDAAACHARNALDASVGAVGEIATVGAIIGPGKSLGSRVPVDQKRLKHIFRRADGHVNPKSAGSKARYTRLFEEVASNPANYRPDAVEAGVLSLDAANAGMRAFTQPFRNGQVWVFVRNGIIENGGVNRLGQIR